MSTPLCRAVMFLWFFFGENISSMGFFVPTISICKIFFFLAVMGTIAFGCSISNISKFVLSTLGKLYYFFFTCSGLEMNSTICRVLGVPYPITIQDVENGRRVENRILKIQAFLFLDF